MMVRDDRGSFDIPDSWSASDDGAFHGPAITADAPMLAGKARLSTGRATISAATISLHVGEKLSDAVAKHHGLFAHLGAIKLVEPPRWKHGSIEGTKLVALSIALPDGTAIRQIAAYFPRSAGVFTALYFSGLEAHMTQLEPLFFSAVMSFRLPADAGTSSLPK